MVQRVEQQQEEGGFFEWAIGSLLLLLFWCIKSIWRSLVALRWANLTVLFIGWFAFVKEQQILAAVLLLVFEIVFSFLRPMRRFSVVQRIRDVRREKKAAALANWWGLQAGLVGAKELQEGVTVGKIYRTRNRRVGGVVGRGFLLQRPGLSQQQVANAVFEFARLLGAGYGTVEVVRNTFHIRFYQSKPQFAAGALDFPRGVHAAVDRLPVGVDIEGQQVAVQLFESNLLVAGLPGSGKSGFVNAFLGSVAPLVESGLVKLSGIDPKVVELSPWASMFENIATEPEEFTELLQALNQEMDDRYRGLMADGSRKIRPSSRTPILVLVIDELAEVTSSGDSKRDKEVTALIRRLVQKGRAAGVFVLAATQRPSTDIVPSSLRDLFVQRVAFALANKESARMILGAYDTEGAAVEDGPWTISGAERGVGFLMAASDRSPKKFKTWWVADERVQEIVRGGR